MFMGGVASVNPQHVIAYKETGMFTQRVPSKQDYCRKVKGLTLFKHQRERGVS